MSADNKVGRVGSKGSRQTMSIINAIGIVLVTGVVGLICGGMVTIAYADWYYQSHNIGSGFLVVFNAIAGGIAGCIFGGVVLALVGPDFWKALAWSAGLIVSGSGGLASLLYLCSDYYPAPRISGDKLMFELEVKYPAGHEKPEGEFAFKLTEMKDGVDNGSWLGEIQIEHLRLENARWIVPASVELRTSCPQRTANFSVGDNALINFTIPLPGRPGKAELEWSQWQAQDGKSSEAGSFEYRFRVSRIPEPRVLSDEEHAAEVEAAEQAKFENIPLDAPLEDWFPHIEQHIPEHRRLKALENITRKPNYITELSALMLTDGPYDEAARKASSALHVVARLERPSVELVPSVVAAGRDIIERIKKFNKTTPEQDPSYEGAADIDIRFSGWLHAADKFHKLSQHDFKTQLQEIIELAGIREDSIALQSDVVRVGAFYRDRWKKTEGIDVAP
jgi:hypothetical protein